MIHMYTRLMYPEPENTGGGGDEKTYSLESAPDEPQEVAEPPAEGGETPPDGGETPPTAEEYALTFDDDDNINADYQAVLTAAAKETEGLDAATASRLFHNLTQRLQAEGDRVFQADDAALKKEWGREFEPRVKRTLGFMKRTLTAAGCTPEECAMFENPRGIRVMNKLMAVYSEGKAVGGGAADAPSMSKEELIRAKTKEIIAERNKAEPDHAKLRQLRREINDAVGLNL